MLSTDNTSLNIQFNASERAKLDELETATFYEVGKALEEIREQKLYRETHKTFEAYCQGINQTVRRNTVTNQSVIEN